MWLKKNDNISKLYILIVWNYWNCWSYFSPGLLLKPPYWFLILFNSFSLLWSRHKNLMEWLLANSPRASLALRIVSNLFITWGPVHISSLNLNTFSVFLMPPAPLVEVSFSIIFPQTLNVPFYWPGQLLHLELAFTYPSGLSLNFTSSWKTSMMFPSLYWIFWYILAEHLVFFHVTFNTPYH